MKLNQKGFGAVEILLTIIAVALITGVGYYVYNSSKSDNKENKSGSSRTVEENSDIEVAENKKIDPYEGWKTYDRNGLTFNYPPGFYVDNSSDNFVEVSSFVPDGKLDCPAAGYDVPKCEVKISILEKGTFTDSNEYYGWGPKNSDLKEVAQKIINSIKRQ